MHKRILIVLCSTMLLVAAVVVVLGAYTRLADAGLGCPDWPTCYGHLWVPTSEVDIAHANTLFEDTPVETDKTWPEQIHRIFASSLGLFILGFFTVMLFYQRTLNSLKIVNSISILLIALVGATVARIGVGESVEPLVGIVVVSYFLNIVRFWRADTHGRTLFLLTAVLAGLVIVQGLFGMWTVTLKLWPQVVTGHLLGGFATISLIALLWSKLVFPRFTLALNGTFERRLLVLAFAFVFIQIVLGGWTASNYAALACPELPTCQSYWLPKTDFKAGFDVLQSVGPNYLGGMLDNDARVAIHLSHRIGAIIVMFIVGFLSFNLVFKNVDRGAKQFGICIFSILCIQLFLGVSNIIFSLPIRIAVAHNAVGALLLMSLFIGLCRHSKSRSL